MNTLTFLIEPSPNAPDGIRETLSEYSEADFSSPCVILCRYVAPIVQHAFGLLQRDIPCTIIGRDIGAQLANLVEKMRAPDLPTLQTRLQHWCSVEVDRALSEGRNPDFYYDQHDCLVYFINGLDHDSTNIPSLLAKISLMFADSGATRVQLCSIHKSKGLEWPRVFLLDRHLIPSRWAKAPWQRVQERNLLYVAITRAMAELYYINSGCWKKQ